MSTGGPSNLTSASRASTAQPCAPPTAGRGAGSSQRTPLAGMPRRVLGGSCSLTCASSSPCQACTPGCRGSMPRECGGWSVPSCPGPLLCLSRGPSVPRAWLPLCSRAGGPPPPAAARPLHPSEPPFRRLLAPSSRGHPSLYHQQATRGGAAVQRALKNSAGLNPPPRGQCRCPSACLAGKLPLTTTGPWAARGVALGGGEHWLR
mmetsp:Transcript_59405/g.145902  ORF Transcript_59405/g.145902 Transcript_59405/m.145902 type:complete len:205 (+) Transcript_59405:1844-2458(+)